MDAGLGSAPPLRFDQVFHLGFLDDAGARRPSLDGPGISVSNRPASWRKILKTNAPEHRFGASRAEWVDALGIGPRDFDMMRRWAERSGLIEQVAARVSLWEDPQSGELVERAEDIFHPADPAFRSGSLLTETYRVTKAGHAALERWSDPFAWEQAAILLYARAVILPKRPAMAGIWWSEPDRPDCLSAPSGILFPERIHLLDIGRVDDGMGPSILASGA